MVELRRVPARDLRPNPKNWRRHPETQRRALASMLADVGFAGAVLARETPEGLELIDGHLRSELDPDAVLPVLILDVDEAEADRLLATFDPLSSMAVTDADALALLLEGAKIADAELRRWVEELAGLDTKAGLTDPDAVPDPPAEPITKAGDLWLLGEHRVLCGDARSAEDLTRLLGGQEAGLVFTDPPYGIAYLAESDGLAAKGHLKGDVVDKASLSQWEAFGETVYAWCDAVLESLRPGGCYYVCMGWEHLGHVVGAMRHLGSRPYTTIVWDRAVPRMTSFPQDYIPVTEYIVYGWKTGKRRNNGPAGPEQTTLWRFTTMRATEMEHPTQKPVELVENAILNSARPDDLVVDLFLGSGTTLLAAERTGRRCSAMEIDPRYVDVAVRRWEEFTGQTAVLDV